MLTTMATSGSVITSIETKRMFSILSLDQNVYPPLFFLLKGSPLKADRRVDRMSRTDRALSFSCHKESFFFLLVRAMKRIRIESVSRSHPLAGG